MKYINKKALYTGTLVIGLIILAICFYFRYSYIDILGFDRPLKLASIACAGLGAIGALIAIIDGVNKHFKGHILTLAILNLIMVFTYPILLTVEKSMVPPENPYADQAPDKGNTTSHRKDSAFIIEGEIYKFPVSLRDFKDRGFDYYLGEDEDKTVATIQRMGESAKADPTWFTDGLDESIFKEFYLLEAVFKENSEDIETMPIELLRASVKNNNRDFEVRGIRLEDSIHTVKNAFEDELSEDPNNQSTPTKAYYLPTSDGKVIKLIALHGYIQTIEIYDEDLK